MAASLPRIVTFDVPLHDQARGLPRVPISSALWMSKRHEILEPLGDAKFTRFG